MLSRTLSTKLVDKLLSGISLGKSSHIEEICPRKPLDIGELLFEIPSKALNDPRTQLFAFLPGKDVVANLPLEENQLLIDGEGCLDLGRADARLEPIEHNRRASYEWTRSVIR